MLRAPPSPAYFPLSLERTTRESVFAVGGILLMSAVADQSRPEPAYPLDSGRSSRYAFDGSRTRYPVLCGRSASASALGRPMKSWPSPQPPAAPSVPHQSACTIVVTTANQHGNSEPVTSGSYGLDEAIVDAASGGSGIKLIPAAPLVGKSMLTLLGRQQGWNERDHQCNHYSSYPLVYIKDARWRKAKYWNFSPTGLAGRRSDTPSHQHSRSSGLRCYAPNVLRCHRRWFCFVGQHRFPLAGRT